MKNETDSQYFDHERLDAYTLARRAVQFVNARKGKLRGLPGGAGPQLERAVVGAHSNLCSGASHRGAEARRQLRTARSEASEAGGCTDLAFDLGVFDEQEHRELRSILLRLCACLRGLGG